MAFRAAYRRGVIVIYKYIYTHPTSSGSLKVGELIKILESLDFNKALYIFYENGKACPLYDIAQRLQKRVKEQIEIQEYWLNEIDVEIIRQALLVYDEPMYREIRARQM